MPHIHILDSCISWLLSSLLSTCTGSLVEIIAEKNVYDSCLYTIVSVLDRILVIPKMAEKIMKIQVNQDKLFTIISGLENSSLD